MHSGRKLAAEDPQIPSATEKSSVPAVADLEVRLEAQRKQLDDLLRRFTDEHPDVVSARRIIGQLESEVEQQRAAAARRTGYRQARPGCHKPGCTSASVSRPPKRRPAWPPCGPRSVCCRRSWEEARAVAGRVPQVETELAQLNRDYEVIRKNYELLVARRESANMGVKLDEASQLADYRLIEPPRVSKSASFPSRLHLALIAAVLSIVAGILATVLVEQTWPRVHTVAALQRLSRDQVIGSISSLVTADAAHGARTATMRFAAAVGVLLVLQGAWLVWIGLHSRIG
jgi:hypothetical protein